MIVLNIPIKKLIKIFDYLQDCHYFLFNKQETLTLNIINLPLNKNKKPSIRFITKPRSPKKKKKKPCHLHPKSRPTWIKTPPKTIFKTCVSRHNMWHGRTWSNKYYMIWTSSASISIAWVILSIVGSINAMFWFMLPYQA